MQRWCKLVVQCCCKVADFSMARRAAKVVQRCRKLVVQLRVQIDTIAGKNKVEPEPRALGKAARAAIADWLNARRAAGIESPYVFTGFGGRGDRNPSTHPFTGAARGRDGQRSLPVSDLPSRL